MFISICQAETKGRLVINTSYIITMIYIDELQFARLEMSSYPHTDRYLKIIMSQEDFDTMVEMIKQG